MSLLDFFRRPAPKPLYDTFLYRTPERYIEHLQGIVKNNCEMLDRHRQMLADHHDLYYHAAQDRYVHVPRKRARSLVPQMPQPDDF